MNDAKVDSVGRIWAGTMDDAAAVPVGCFYRFDPDRQWCSVDEGYPVTNGPTFSPDGLLMYHTYSLRSTIVRSSITDEGALTDKRVWVAFPKDAGWPGGMATDAEGFVWVAHYGGGRVSRFNPDGCIDGECPLPASQITSCVFGGPNLDRLFVTSAACDRPDEPLAGALFEIEPGVRALEVPPFGG